MAKVFNGGEFLKQRSVDIVFSNGVTCKVGELGDNVMKAFDKLDSDDTGIVEIRAAIAIAVGKESKDLSGIGIVELRGVMDFLTSNLFG